MNDGGECGEVERLPDLVLEAAEVDQVDGGVADDTPLPVDVVDVLVVEVLVVQVDDEVDAVVGVPEGGVVCRLVRSSPWSWL